MDSELLTLANQKAKAGDYEEALRLFREAGGAEGAYGEGACLYKLGRCEDARAALMRCLEIDLSFDKANVLLERLLKASQEDALPPSKGRSKKSFRLAFWLILFVGALPICYGIWQSRKYIQSLDEADQRAKPVGTVPVQQQLTYRVLDEEVYDAPIKTQLEMSVLVSGDVSRGSLRRLLNDLSRQMAERTGFKHHPRPTHLVLAAYLTEEHYRSGAGQWVAQFLKIGDRKPEFHINERQMGQIGKAPEEKYGRTEDERKTIYYELVKAEDRANREATAKYPDIDPMSPDFSPQASMEQLEKQYDYAGQIVVVYTRQVAEKHHLTDDQIKGISQEGLMKDWPMPE